MIFLMMVTLKVIFSIHTYSAKNGRASTCIVKPIIFYSRMRRLRYATVLFYILLSWYFVAWGVTIKIKHIKGKSFTDAVNCMQVVFSTCFCFFFVFRCWFLLVSFVVFYLYVLTMF